MGKGNKQGKGNKKKKRTQNGQQGGDEEMRELDDAGAPGAGAPDAEEALPAQVSLDDLIQQQEKRIKAKQSPGGVKKKQLARGQRSKAQQQRKVDRLDKAMAAQDKRTGKCNKKQAAKHAKAQLAALY